MPPRRAKSKKSKRRAMLVKRHRYDDAEHPVTLYLDSFGDDSARVMRAALDSIADILSDGKTSADELAWHRLRAQHVAALRGRMLRLFAPSTTNRYLAAIRGVMKAAWRLDLIENQQTIISTNKKGIRKSRKNNPSRMQRHRATRKINQRENWNQNREQTPEIQR